MFGNSKFIKRIYAINSWRRSSVVELMLSKSKVPSSISSTNPPKNAWN
jgi:hypothetical protein